MRVRVEGCGVRRERDDRGLVEGGGERLERQLDALGKLVGGRVAGRERLLERVAYREELGGEPLDGVLVRPGDVGLADAADVLGLGLGAQPPDPSWGNMLNTGRGFMSQAPWLSIVPGMAIFLTVLGFNLLGDGLRDALDPRQRGR